VRTFALRFARQPQQPFARTVDRNLLGDDFGANKREALRQRCAQFLRHAGHLVEFGEAAEIDPVPKLLHAHLALRFRHADLRQRFGQAAPRQPDQRRSFRRDVALKRRLLDEGRSLGRCDF
jgi:hypothetical protein